MSTLSLSPALAAFLLVLQLSLMLAVGATRGKANVGVGTGGDQHLERKIRRHGNLAENAALFLAAFVLAEAFIGASTLLLAAAAVFSIARLAHALSFSSLQGSHLTTGFGLFPALRMVGAFGTLAAGLMLAWILATAAIAQL
ncbi:MAG: MAPEG family protein [Pseudomonadota bacterium]